MILDIVHYGSFSLTLHTTTVQPLAISQFTALLNSVEFLTS